jgi:membrane protease YdiL (CAAX protease family)
VENPLFHFFYFFYLYIPPVSSPDSSPTLTPDIAHRTGDPDRFIAAFEVFLCSGVPTQLVIGQGLALAGLSPFVNGEPQPGPLFMLAVLDSVVLVALIFILMRAHGEAPADAFIGSRSVAREAGLGVLLVPALFLGVGVTMLVVRAVVPWLHNVASNPFERLIQTPGDAVAFAIVAIVAGGLREEIQRAFLLRRFELHLGGSTVGLVVVSAAFGAGHFVQGWDAAVATALLGLTWGMLYLRRRSIVAPVVSHSGYNALQIVQVLTIRHMGAV